MAGGGRARRGKGRRAWAHLLGLLDGSDEIALDGLALLGHRHVLTAQLAMSILQLRQLLLLLFQLRTAGGGGEVGSDAIR